MLKKLNIILKNHLHIIFLGLVVFLSIGQTAKYYFFSDDYASLYFIQQKLPHPAPFHFYDIIFTPLYKLFGLNPNAYFLLGAAAYFVASVSVFYFLKKLTRNTTVALFSSLIFATGIIGIDQFTMMIVSITGGLNVLFVSLTLLLSICWVETRKIRYYLATLLMYLFSIMLIPFRAFPLIAFLPTVEFFLIVKKENPINLIKTIIFMIIRFIPFIFIIKFLNILAYSGVNSNPLTVSADSFLNRLTLLFSGNFINEMFSVFGRLMLLNYSNVVSAFNIGLGSVILFLILGLYFNFTKKYSRLARCLLIITFLTIEGYLGNMLVLPSFDSNGVFNRYLTLDFLAFCAIYPISIYLISFKLSEILKKKSIRFLFPLSISLLTVLLISASRNYVKTILTERSQPARIFIRQLKQLLPEISGSNLFYIDRADYYPIASRYGSIVTGAYRSKEVTLAALYKRPIESIKIVEDFSKVIDYFNKNQTSHFFSFYYDKKGLHQTTDKVLSLLKAGDKHEILPLKAIYGNDIYNPYLEIPASGVYSLTPLQINLTLRISPLEGGQFNFPYYHLDTNNTGKLKEVTDFFQNPQINKNLIFNYLLSRKKYYDSVKIDTSSSHVFYTNKFLTDDNINTWWMAEAGPWLLKEKTWVKIDLSDIRTIGRLIWKPLRNRDPSKYNILTSADSVRWNTIMHASRSITPEITSVKFDPVEARFIQLEINKTSTDWEPALAEIEAVENEYRDIDIPTALRIKNNPFEFIKNEQELQITYDYLKQGGYLNLNTLTDKDLNINNGYTAKIPLALDGQIHGYSLLLSPRGINLEKIRLDLNFPAHIELIGLNLNNITLKELLQ